MRKNLLLILFAVLLAASMPLTAFASDASMLTSPDGKYMYSVDENGNATLEKYLADEENETTPTEVDGHPVVAIGGAVEEVEELNRQGFAAVFPIVPGPVSLERAMEEEYARANIERTVTQIMRTIDIKPKPQ